MLLEVEKCYWKCYAYISPCGSNDSDYAANYLSVSIPSEIFCDRPDYWRGKRISSKSIINCCVKQILRTEKLFDMLNAAVLYYSGSGGVSGKTERR